MAWMAAYRGGRMWRVGEEGRWPKEGEGNEGRRLADCRMVVVDNRRPEEGGMRGQDETGSRPVMEQ